MRAAWLVVLAVFLAPGCLEQAARDLREEVADSKDAQILALAEADDGSGTVEDGYLLQAAVGPEGPLAGFTWRLPPGAAHHSEGLDRDVVTLQFVPLGAGLPYEQVVVDALTVAAFVVDGDEAVPLAVSIDVPGSIEGTSNGQELDYNLTPMIRSVSLGFDAEDLGGSDEIRLVAGAQGDARPFDLVMLVLPSDPFEEDHDEPRSPAEAARLLEGHRLLRLEQVGSGAGLWAHSFSDVRWPWAELDMRVRHGTVELSEDTVGTPAGPVVTRTTSASLAGSSGWAAGHGYEGSNSFAGEWSLAGQARDLALADRSPTFGQSSDPALGLAGALAGYPLYSFTADGAGEVEATFQVRGVDTSDETFRIFSVAGFGTPLVDLIGVEGRDIYQGWGAATRWLAVGPDVPPLAA